MSDSRCNGCGNSCGNCCCGPKKRLGAVGATGASGTTGSTGPSGATGPTNPLFAGATAAPLFADQTLLFSGLGPVRPMGATASAFIADGGGFITPEGAFEGDILGARQRFPVGWPNGRTATSFAAVLNTDIPAGATVALDLLRNQEVLATVVFTGPYAAATADAEGPRGATGATGPTGFGSFTRYEAQDFLDIRVRTSGPIDTDAVAVSAQVGVSVNVGTIGGTGPVGVLFIPPGGGGP